MVLLYTLYFFWQQFHYAKQNYGLARWQTQSQFPWIDQAFYLGTTLIVLLGLLGDGPQNFFGFVLHNPTAISLSKFQALLIVFAMTGAYLVWKPKQWIHSLGHVMIFSSSYLLTENFAEGWLYLNVFHNLQYLHFMKKFEKKMSFLFFPAIMTLLLYIVQNHAINGLIIFSIPASLGILMAMNFTHYTLDGLIWKRSNH